MEKIVWKSEKFDGITVTKLHETSSGKEIRINLQNGSVMKEHQAPGAIMVQVLRGKIEFSVGADSTVLNELDMITLEANIAHALVALEDSIIRLSLSKNDDVSRVFKVLNWFKPIFGLKYLLFILNFLSTKIMWIFFQVIKFDLSLSCV